MTDKNKTGFSLDIDVDPAAGLKPLPDLVAFDLCRAYPADEHALLLHNTRTGERAMVRPEVYAALRNCAQFDTLDRHAERIVALNPGMQGQQSDIRSVLKTMLKSGMLVSARQTCDRLRRNLPDPAAVPDPGKPVVAIITWERPAALERLLRSIGANCANDGIHRLYVVDDSRQGDNIAQNRELTARYSRTLKMPLQYFGRAEQRVMLETLAARLPQHEKAVRFLADQSLWRDHWTSGLARNLALLLSCGRRLVMLDDDTVCDVYQPGRQRPDITFSDLPRAADFFAAEAEWQHRRQALNPDPVQRHMQCLGLTFSQALATLGANHFKAAGLAGATGLQTSELNPDSPVLMTECGSLGCPGTNDNTWLPDMHPDSLEAMLKSPEKTRNALDTRLVWSGREQPHFAPRPNMSQITGFDNRAMLPPYLPILRGEDRLFGHMLDFLLPAGVTLDYPWAVPHLPLPRREWQAADRDFTPSGSFPWFFAEQILRRKSDCIGAEPETRFDSLASYFRDLAAAPVAELAARHRDYVLTQTSAQWQHLDRLLAQAEKAPDAWKRYLEQGLGQLKDGLDRYSRKELPLEGQPPGLADKELVGFWRDTWSGFADCLQAWPQIRQAAAALHD